MTRAFKFELNARVIEMHGDRRGCVRDSRKYEPWKGDAAINIYLIQWFCGGVDWVWEDELALDQ
jgi:hypothetical protein